VAEDMRDFTGRVTLGNFKGQGLQTMIREVDLSFGFSSKDGGVDEVAFLPGSVCCTDSQFLPCPP
jgi:hypothetical protein